MTQDLPSSELLTRIIDGSPIPAFVINNRHIVVHWNTAIEALSRIKKEEIIGTDQQWRAFYAQKRPTMADLIVSGAPPKGFEVYYSNEFQRSQLIDGAYEAEDFFPDLGENGKWLHFTASPIRNDRGVTVGAIETLQDITEHRSAEEALEESHENLRYYLRHITRAQEEERRRIARELHDDTAQVLGSLSRQVDNFIRKKNSLNTETARFLQDMQAQLNRAVQEVHRFSQALRLSVLDDLGLIPALRSLTKSSQEYGVATELKVLGEERRFSSEVELLLFRIVQEALNNVGKHAHASEARVVMELGENRIKVTVSDNGRGFTLGKLDDLPRSGKLGLAGIQERVRLLGGILEVKSAPGAGTTVTVDAPC